MSVKRFVAADMRRALELVRQELGPEAIILSSRRVKQGVEIITTLQPQARIKKDPADVRIDGVDVPMTSDGAWREQKAVESVVSQSQALRGAAVDRSLASSLEADAAQARGPASGKTSAELAREIDAARARMMASKRQTSFADTPIGKLSAEDFRSDYRAQERVRASADRSAEQNTWKPETDGWDDRPQTTSARHDQQNQLNELQSELADMRLLLEEQLNRMSQSPTMSTPIKSGVFRRLRHMGLTDKVAEVVLEIMQSHRTVQEAWSDALAVLSRQIPTTSEDLVMRGGVFAFVGPTGVGKTTTIAKLAARYVLEHGPSNVTLVTTDTYRIAAHDQLRSLGRILNVQVKVVDDNQDLPAVLRSLKHCPLVLIDTAGFRLGDPQLKEQLQAISSIGSITTFLVMSANAQLQMMKATIHAHMGLGIKGAVLTKLDETASLGEAISLMIEQQLPLAYVTDGQEIPQDLSPAKGHRLVARAVSLMKSGMHSGDVMSGQLTNHRPTADKQLYL